MGSIRCDDAGAILAGARSRSPDPYPRRDNRTGLAAGVPTNLDGASQIGAVAQASYFIIPNRVEPFVRYEYIHFDDVYFRNNQGGIQAGARNLTGNDELSMLTAGANYYLNQHQARFTLDVLYSLDPVPVANAGTGLLQSIAGDQWVIRSQFQFSF